MKRPAPNALVSVLLQDPDRRLDSRVEELHGGDTVAIAPPSGDGVVVPLSCGDPIGLEWTSARGLVRADGFVVSRSVEPLPYVFVRLDSSHIVQRRGGVRVETVLEASVRQTAGVTVSCRTLDVSGGGMRAFVPLDLVPGEPVDVVLELPGEAPVALAAKVIRGTEPTGYVFRFVGIDPREQERLIRFVFVAHAREFSTLRRSA